jgi:hypothetical protein
MRKLARKDELRPHKRGDAQFPWADEMANAAGQPFQKVGLMNVGLA